MQRNRPFPYVEIGGHFSFRFPVLIKTKKLKKCEKRCKYANDRLQSLKTVPSKMWKAPATFRKVQFPITETFRPGRVLKVQRESHRWSLQPCIGPKAEKMIPSNLGGQFATLGANVPAFINILTSMF
jgi:hypothetical protein